MREPLDYTYAIENGAVTRSDGLLLPSDPANADTEEYLFWRSLGNLPTQEQKPLAPRKLAALAAVDFEHQRALLQLTGNPTEAERNTWAGKVELARAILAGAVVSADQAAFLSARGLATDAAKTAYANEVMGNSARYWALVGMADKVRSDCKARITQATDEASFAQAGVDNRAQLAAALAQALA